MKIRTQSRFKPLRDFIRQPALHAAIGALAAMAVIYWLENSNWLTKI